MEGPLPELTTNQKGAIAELAVIAEAIRHEIDVYRPVVEGGRCDLVLGSESQLVRVQCKWGTRKGGVVAAHLQSSCRLTGGGHLRRSYDSEHVDVIAIHCAELDQSYYLPISLVAGQHQIHLRLTPARNNQRARLKWAEQYRDIGAIAQLGERLHGMQEVAGSSPASSTLSPAAVPKASKRGAAACTSCRSA
jgi:hypothetical protein